VAIVAALIHARLNRGGWRDATARPESAPAAGDRAEDPLRPAKVAPKAEREILIG
jgi:hypothetical protein